MKNLKRTLSMLLALLMLLSAVPMMATAQDIGGMSASASGSEVIVYDFELEKTDFLTTNNKKFAGESLNGKYVVPAIEELYNNADIDWKYATNNAALLKDSGEFPQASAMMYFGGANNYGWSGFRAGLKDGGSYPAGLWVALNIRVPFAGKYNLSLDHQTRKTDGTTRGEVYLIEGGYNDAATIDAKLNADTLVNVVNCSSNDAKFANGTADLGSVDLKKGQYTIVFKAAEKREGSGGCYFYLRSLSATLLEKDPNNTPVNGPTTDQTGPAYTPGAFTPESFEVAYSDLKNTDGKSFAAGALTDSKNLNALNAAYTAGSVNWKYAADNIASFTNSKITASNLYAFGGEGNAWAGLRLGMQFRQAGRTDRFPAGYWTAFTVKVPAAGNYKITLDYQKNAEGTPLAEAYVLPGALTDSAAIDALLTRDNMRAGINFQGRSYSFGKPETGDLGVMNLAAGEYTVVLKAAKIGKNTAYMYINGLKFAATTAAEYKPTLPPVEQPVVINPMDYSFELGGSNMTNLNEGALAGANLADFVNRDALDEYYEQGLIKWKYAADNAASFGSNATATHYIGQSSNYTWTGIRMGVQVQDGGKKTYPAGWWTAFTFKAPATGTKYLYLDYQMCANATPCAEIYVIKGALTKTADIEKQMTKANLLRVIDMRNSDLSKYVDASSYIGKVNFASGEYTLVVKAVDDSGNNAAYIYLNALRFENEAPPAPSEVIYDFDLSKKEGGIYQSGTKLMDQVDDLQKRYERGLLNWCYLTMDFSLGGGAHAFNRAYGMVMYTMHDQWMAFKFQSPGEGQYTLSLNHGRGGRGALGAIYILPGDTTDIAAAMDHGNRVGKVTFYNEDGNVQVSSPYTTILDTFNFEADQEYIMVVEAYADTPYYKNNGYMWISQLVAQRGDHRVETESQRRVQAVVVDKEPCVTMEPTIALAAAEIDGQDYLFMPTEGRALYIFNLEDGVMVRKVTGTPFPICRGITVDKDGMVWAVGDAQVLWRYDPRTNTSITTKNYKFSGIDNAGCGYAMTVDDEGNVYFGTNPSSCIAKYNPQTNEFTKAGGVLPGGNGDGDYANVPIIKDGFLYATTAGDKNGDGLKTAWAYKIDLATNQIVKEIEITEAYGDTEVMVRGGGICGNTLFYGGISMKSYVAIDLETFELKDYGDQIYGSIGYSPTPEIDGKCYMVIGGVMHLYDSATDSFERIYGMETANVGFRPTGLSAVTLSNNPLFPGITYVTYTATGVKYYNMETKQVTTPHLYDEEKEGSGQIVRVVVAGEEGDNNIYVGGYNTINCAIINTDTGITTNFRATSSQTDALLWYNGVLYAGNYNAGNAVRINLEDYRRNVILQSYKSQYHQARVHALEAGDDMLFVGTIPDSFLFGGCLGVVDLNTLQSNVYHNLIPDQIVTSLAYNPENNILFGGTSRGGGTSAKWPEAVDNRSAVIFAFDVDTREVVAELDLRKYFPELAKVNPTLDYIDGIAADPNIAENGKVWGMIGEILFYFTFNKDTNTFSVKEVATYGYTMPGNISRGWDAIPFDFDDEGYIYAAFHTTGGMRKLKVDSTGKVTEDIRLNCEVPKTFCLGNDGNFYYATGLSEVKMLPLNVQEEDWKAAEAVDAKINALGPASLETEAEIKAAREAYNALNLGRRALTQSYDKLLIAETDLLEVKIDAIGEITLEKEALIKELLAIYEALPAKEKGYVKNYSKLNAADIEIQNTINRAEAARVQKILDDGLKALGNTITLEHEEKLIALRAEYDALSFAQRLLVNATKLEQAEAQIRKLRDEKIAYLKQLIAAIGEVTLEDEATINEAMDLYDNFLRMAERAQVDNATLLAANKSLTKLQKEAAAKVDALILAIGDSIDHSSKDAIEAARKAYDALTPASKKYVQNLDLLTGAEALYAELGMNPTTLIIIIAVAGGVLLAAAAVVVILVLKKKKAAVPAEAEETAEEETPAEPEA